MRMGLSTWTPSVGVGYRRLAKCADASLRTSVFDEHSLSCRRWPHGAILPRLLCARTIEALRKGSSSMANSDVTRRKESAHKLARTMLEVSTRNASASMGVFADWLMLGLGASFAALAAKWSEVTNFVHLKHLHAAVTLYVLALVLGVVARLLRAMVESGLAARDALNKELSGADFSDVDFETLKATFEKGLLLPYRLLVRRNPDTVTHGLAFIAKTSQVQAMLVLVSALCGIAALAILGYEFNT